MLDIRDEGDGITSYIRGSISWPQEAIDKIKGLPTQIALDLDLDANDDGTYTVFDIVDQDMN